MSKQIVALAVDKIQTFLTEVIHSHVQEKQTEDATLQKIMSSSYQISSGFFVEIQDVFPEDEKEVLLQCSGVYVFRSALSERELEKRLNALFVKFYLKSQGQKLIRWVYFSSCGLDNISAIKKAKESLKQAKNWNKILEKNQDLLFSFNQTQNNEDRDWKNYFNEESYPAFARDINALYKKEEGKEEKKRFRIVVIKADLDGMGALFKGIHKFEDYQKISQILNDEISLDGLHRAALKASYERKRGWLFPLYIAGDDIFFAVAIEDMINGINVCRQLMQTVNGNIEKSGNATKLTISAGVEISFNRQPIRYYMDMVEKQLKYAKSETAPDALAPYSRMKISISNLTFFDIDYQSIAELKKSLKCKKRKNGSCHKCENCRKNSEIKRAQQNVPIWDYFISDLKLLSYIRSEKSSCSDILGKANFFYTLLEDITSEEIQNDNIKYINHILYHLMPVHFEDYSQQVKQTEMLLNSALLRQLYRKKENGVEINLEKKTKKRFETYLRLMLLFCDSRFQISQKDAQEIEEKKYEQRKEDICRYLFKQPRKYLYEMCLKEKNLELTRLFAEEVTKKITNNGKPVFKSGYKRLDLEKSMFFRMRDVEHISVEKAAKMIEQRNPSTKERCKKILELNKKRIEENKLPNHLYFDRDQFCDLAAKTGGWNPDFIDSLMLFYQYNELVMKLGKSDSKTKEI